MPADRYQVAVDAHVGAGEIIALQTAAGSSGWGIGTVEQWTSCISQSLCIVTAREWDRTLVGCGFLVGTVRHAQLAEMTVHPEFRRKGIGRCLVRELLAFARDNRIRYVGLIRDPSQPWLKQFYESTGFHEIDFAMSLEPL